MEDPPKSNCSEGNGKEKGEREKKEIGSFEGRGNSWWKVLLKLVRTKKDVEEE